MRGLWTGRIVAFVLHSQANAHMDEHSANCCIYCHSLHSAALLFLPCNAGGERPLHEVDEHSSNARTVKAALCCGLYPQVGKSGL